MPTKKKTKREIVLSVRLPGPELDKLEKMASEYKVGVSTLARLYILHGMEETPPAQTSGTILPTYRPKA